MTSSIKKITLMLKKEFIDFPQNKNISIMCLIPIGMTLFFVLVQGEDVSTGIHGLDLLYMSMNVNLVIVSTFALSFLISEEQEKNTYPSLWLASVSLLDVLFAKTIMIFLLSLTSHIMLYLIIGISINLLGGFMLVSIIITIIMIGIGTIIGLLSKNQMSVSVLGLPVVFGFFILPMAASLERPWSQIALLSPSYHYGQLLYNLGTKGLFLSVNFMVILLWLFVTSITLVLVYHKKRVGFSN